LPHLAFGGKKRGGKKENDIGEKEWGGGRGGKGKATGDLLLRSPLEKKGEEGGER